MNDQNEIRLKRDFPLLYKHLREPYTPNYSILQRFIRLFVNTFKRHRRYNELRRKYKFLPYLNAKNPAHTIQLFGIECGDGWFDLIYTLSYKLEREIRKQPVEERGAYAAVQVKEKFGGLRFYQDCFSYNMMSLISEAEKESTTICEYCGNTGKIDQSMAWWKTLCDRCKKKY